MTEENKGLEHVHDENCNHDHEHDHDHDHVYMMKDEEGKEIPMLLLGTFDVNELNKEYAVFINRDNPEEEGVILQIVIEENEEAYFAPIEDSAEWDQVVAEYYRLQESEQQSQ